MVQTAARKSSPPCAGGFHGSSTGCCSFMSCPSRRPFMRLLYDQLDGLTAHHDRFLYLIDLTDARRPSAEVRAIIKERTRRIRPKLDRVAIVVGGNIVIRAMARVVARESVFHR